MTISNLDASVLFPYPMERASHPLDEPRPGVASQNSSGPSGEGQAQASTLEPSAAELAGSVQQLNVELQSFGIQFEFSESDNRLITRVIDSQTGELIRQIPSEEVLRMARSLDQSSGLLLQTTA